MGMDSIRKRSDRTRDNIFKQEDSTIWSDIRKKFFAMGIVRHWNRLSTEAMDLPLLTIFKVRFDGAFYNLI